MKHPRLMRSGLLGAMGLMLTGCAHTNYLLPQANQNLPRGMARYQQSIETQTRALNATLNQAIRTEESVLAHDPGYANGYMRLGDLFLRAGQTQSVLWALTQACHAAPHNATDWVTLGQAEALYGTMAGARLAYHRAIKANPGEWVAFDGLAYLAISRKNLQKAWNDAKTALRLGGGQGPTYDVMGRVLWAKGDPTDALTYYRQAQKVEPSWWQSYYDAGRAELALGDQRLAQKEFARALKVDPSSGPVWQVDSALRRVERTLNGTSSHRRGVS